MKDEYDRAIEDYVAAIRLDENDPYSYAYRGLAYYMKGEYGRAIEDYVAAIRLDENYAYSYYGRGLAYSSLGELTKARADLNKALELGHDKDEIEDALTELKKMEENGMTDTA